MRNPNVRKLVDRSEQASEINSAVRHAKTLRAKKAVAPKRHARGVRSKPRATRRCFQIIINNALLKQVILANKDILIAYAPHMASIIFAVATGGCLIYATAADKPALASAALNIGLFSLLFGKAVVHIRRSKADGPSRKPPGSNLEV